MRARNFSHRQQHTPNASTSRVRSTQSPLPVSSRTDVLGQGQTTPTAFRPTTSPLLEGAAEIIGLLTPQAFVRIDTGGAARGIVAVVDVTVAKVDKYVERRLKDDKKAPATINRETQLLGQAFRLGIENNRIVR